jgi:hypothetical protein
MRLVAVDTGAVKTEQPWPQVEWVRPDGVRETVELKQARVRRFEQARPVRTIPNHVGQTHTPGYYYCATTKTLIDYESNLERMWLTLLDFDVTVEAIAAQPLRFLGPVGDEWFDHVPDFFVRRSSGEGCLVDVKNPGRANDDEVIRQRELTSQVCLELGFEYQFATSINEYRWANINWLSGFRRKPLVGSEQMERILHVARQPVTVEDLCAFGDDPSILRPVVFHLCWNQQLTFDLEQPLRNHTLLTAGDL